MALTSPDNVWTPDDGDQYALVQDLGAMADSVQTAFNRRANMYVGTSAQRTAFTTAPNGVHWQDTNGNQWEYVRLGGAWRVWKPQAAGYATGHPPLTPSTNIDFPVSFPAGLFSSVPSISLQMITPASRLRDVEISYVGSSTSGFSIRYFNYGSIAYTDVNVRWIAVQGD